MATILFAPNVHTGGGRVLMEALGAAPDGNFDQAIIDSRMHAVSAAFSKEATLVVRNGIGSRIHAEWFLWRSARKGDTVLCLHSLPPLFPLRARVVVLIQNRLLLEHGALTAYPWKTRLRISVERMWAKYLQSHCNRYLVQTPSMGRTLRPWLRREVPVMVVPFVPQGMRDKQCPESGTSKKYDFVYVASGEAHKNHRRLVKALCILADAQLRPSLALTVDPRQYPTLVSEIEHLVAQFGLNIENLGTLNATEVESLYRGSAALVYPSLLESFGLPLIEARQHGLPIIAAELDYVRDVASPVQTFDAMSAVSIARALRRFIGQSEPPVPILSASKFLQEALR